MFSFDIFLKLIYIFVCKTLTGYRELLMKQYHFSTSTSGGLFLFNSLCLLFHYTCTISGIIQVDAIQLSHGILDGKHSERTDLCVSNHCAGGIQTPQAAAILHPHISLRGA